MDALRTEYEKTALHRMGIPLETALARVSWLRGVLDGSPRRIEPQPMPAAKAAGGR